MKNIKRQFGLHFDFHASNDSAIGTTTNIEDIEQYILDTKPDFIQCDCKGHPGISSYPTKVGNAADRFDKDNLKIWCEAAKKHNIPIFVHYSGVADNAYVAKHPDDAELNLNKGPFENDSVCLFGNYVHDLLIPQLKELITEYGINGVWVDGEVWAVHLDSSEKAKPYLEKADTLEGKRAIMRDAFKSYVKTYTDELHRFNPDFKVMSNWLYSSYMPEKPEIGVDFLSGDFVPNDSAFAVRFESRCLSVQNKLWDLMAWTFSHPYYCEKSARQLCQEAATVLSQGGGFQMYITQNRDGSAKKYFGNRFKEVTRFVRDREMLYGKKPLAQLGVLYSADSYYAKADVFNSRGHHDQIEGTVNALLDLQYTANIIFEYQLDSASKYEAIVIPQWENISAENKTKLLKYSENGGKLIVIGAQCCKQFGDLSGAHFELKDGFGGLYVRNNGLFALCNNSCASENPVKESVCDLKEGKGYLYSAVDDSYGIMPAYRTDKIGNGTVTFIPFSFGNDYFNASSNVLQGYLAEVLDSVVPNDVAINRKFIDITMQQCDCGLLLNLVNMKQGRHSLKYNVYEEVDPIYNIELTLNKEFTSVEMPLGEEFEFKCENGKTVISLKHLDIHSIIKLN